MRSLVGATAARAACAALAVGFAGTMSAAVAAAAPGVSDIPGYDGMTSEQRCEAVRARDHQRWLDMVAQLPPGTPPPPEYVNPCVPEDPSFAPGAQEDSTTTDGTGTAGTGRDEPGPSVGTNAPTDIPVAPPGAVIVPVPEHPSEPTTPLPGDTAKPQDAPAPGAGAEPYSGTGHVAPAERGGGSEPATPAGPGGRFESVAPDEGAGGPGPGPEMPGALDAEPKGRADAAPRLVGPAGSDQEPAPAEELLLLLIGLAGGVGGASRLGRPLRSGRWPWSGRSDYFTLHRPSGEQEFVLLWDGRSDRVHRFAQDVPEGGRTIVDEDGSARVVDGDGDTVSRIKAPWAFDALGRPVDTWYEVSPDGTELVQHVEPDVDAVYPILADPESEDAYTPEQRANDMQIANFVGPLPMEEEKQRDEAGDRLAAHPESAQGPLPAAPSDVGVVDTTGYDDGDTWTQTRPDGEVLVHTIPEGTGGQTVDTYALRPDETSTEIRSVDDGRGGSQTWTDNSDGSQGYAWQDGAAGDWHTEYYDPEQTPRRDAPAVTSDADGTNSRGTVTAHNLDGTDSTGDYSRTDDNEYLLAVENPDGTRSTAQSSRNAGGQVNTLIDDEDGRRVVGPDGDTVAVDEDNVPVSADNRFGTADLQYDADEGVWRRFVTEPVGQRPTPLSYWDPYRGQWLEPTPEMIDRGIEEGHIVVDKDGGLRMTDGWRTFIAGAIVEGTGQAVTKPLAGAAKASGDLAALRIAGRFGKVLGPVGAVPGVVLDVQDGRSVPYAVTKGAVSTGVGAIGAIGGAAAVAAGTTALAGAAVTAPVWLAGAGAVAAGVGVGYVAGWAFDKLFG